MSSRRLARITVEFTLVASALSATVLTAKSCCMPGDGPELILLLVALSIAQTVRIVELLERLWKAEGW